ncbi:hypothetical protein HELRODRAFT_108234 [Helobdella robusta]|uniref:PUM-HD domain-containing protein n=1 Tax=Helobdella robusta TaxID=6412 RepID=T1EEH4_HELRO|nr:hypothetical protein HELRODRAFT_108234 [Helobdella robusta]ESN93032.1 hypothetical protein HELRODRAFT_108234 [Helobdella robusta]
MKMKKINKKKVTEMKSKKLPEKMEVDLQDEDDESVGANDGHRDDEYDSDGVDDVDMENDNDDGDDIKKTDLKKVKKLKKLANNDKTQKTKTEKNLNLKNSSNKRTKSSTGNGPRPSKIAKTEEADGGKHKVKLDTSDFGDRKKIRKMRENEFYDVAHESKVLWEQIRQADLDPKERAKIFLKLFKLVSGKCDHLVLAHDTSRVVQTLIKYGDAKQRNSVFLEIKDKILLMIKSKFAKFIIKKFLKYGSKEHRLDIHAVIRKHISKLIKHREASEVVECAYNDYSNAAQRSQMEMEFYGPSYFLEKTANMSMSVIDFVREHPEKKASVVEFLKKMLDSLIEKNVLQMTFVHKLFHDFFEICDQPQRSEMIETLRDHIIHFVHTKLGSRVAMKCFWFGNAKDRKVMIKTFKTFVVKTCKEEFGHFVMLAMFDSVDDTKIVQKAILDEMMKGLDELVPDQYGRKVLLHLTCPRNPLFFHPDVIKILSSGDGNEHSKKDGKTRQMELWSYLSPTLMDWMSSHVRSMTADSSMLLFVAAVVINAATDPTKVMKAVCELVAEPFTMTSFNKGFHFIDDSSGHVTLKKLIQNDRERMKRGEEVLFSLVLLDSVTGEHLKSWLQSNRGCFVIINMLDLENDRVTERIKEYLLNCKSTLKKLESKGAEILLKKLNG